MGNVWSLVFFVLLALAALTSTISLHEVATAYLHEEYYISRKQAALLVSLGVLIMGILCSLSLGVLKEWTIFGLTFFDLLDYVTAKIMLPLGGMLTCVFLGWFVPRKTVRDEFTNWGTVSGAFFGIYLFLLRFVCPLAILAIFLHQFGII